MLLFHAMLPYRVPLGGKAIMHDFALSWKTAFLILLHVCV